MLSPEEIRSQLLVLVNECYWHHHQSKRAFQTHTYPNAVIEYEHWVLVCGLLEQATAILHDLQEEDQEATQVAQGDPR